MKMRISLDPPKSETVRTLGVRIKLTDFEVLAGLARKAKKTPTTIARAILEEALASGVEVE